MKQKPPSKEKPHDVFIEHLHEVFDTKDYKIGGPVIDDEDSWIVEFFVNDKKYYFQAGRLDDPNSDKVWEVSFRSVSSGYNMTGEGSQYKVLAAVLELMTRFLNEKDPDAIVFFATGDSRNRAYQAILKRFAWAKGYEFETYRTGNISTWYTIKPKGQLSYS